MSKSTSAASAAPQTAPAHKISTERTLIQRLFPNREWILVLVLLAELVIFGCASDKFLSGANVALLFRMSVEVGLLSLAMTPIIVTGGIDLSVGSLMGLSAVLLGWLVVAHHVPVLAAIAILLVFGALAGWVNARLISRLNIPALIVTLGTYLLYRGVAEGVTGGTINYSDFPQSFLALGQNSWLGIPLQIPILLLAVIGYWLLLHRSKLGRGLYAAGNSMEGARFAGVPVAKLLSLIYILSGVMAALAAVVYVARLGQAKADAGMGYEMLAITAVVLGGTNINGGSGTIGGTLLGLFAVVILNNGLRLASLPAELADVMTGVLLVAAIVGHGLASRPRATTVSNEGNSEEFEMKNSQVTALAIAMIVTGLIIASGNWMLASRIGKMGSGPTAAPSAAPAPAQTNAAPAGKKITIAMMPKNKGENYFVSCKEGADEAAKELGVELLWDGPTTSEAMKQNEVVEAWITKGVDVIAVSVENKAAISTVLRKAKAKGIKVITWDSDAEPNARDFLINQATAEGIGATLMDQTAKALNNKGNYAIISATTTAANQNEWIKYIEQENQTKFPDCKLVAKEYCNDQRDLAVTKARDILNAHPEVTLLLCPASPAVPGAAEAVEQSGRKDVKVIGLSLPSMCKDFMHKGVVDSIVLWKTADLGYLTVQAAYALANGTLKTGATSIKAGRLGDLEVKGTEVLLGKPFVFTKDNVDQFNF